MSQINFRERKLLRIDLHQAIRSGTIIDHLRLSPIAGAVRCIDAAGCHRYRDTFGPWLTTATECGSGNINCTDAREISRFDFFVRFPVASIANWLLQEFDELAL